MPKNGVWKPAHFSDCDPILAEELFGGWNVASRAIDRLHGGITTRGCLMKEAHV